MTTLATVTAGDVMHAAFTLTGKVLCGASCAQVPFTTSLDAWSRAVPAGTACAACDLEVLRRMGTVRIAC